MGSHKWKPHMLFCNNCNWRWRNSWRYCIWDKGLAPEPIIMKEIWIWFKTVLCIAQKKITSSEPIEVSKKTNSFCHGWRIKLGNYFLTYTSLKLLILTRYTWFLCSTRAAALPVNLFLRRQTAVLCSPAQIPQCKVILPLELSGKDWREPGQSTDGTTPSISACASALGVDTQG